MTTKIYEDNTFTTATETLSGGGTVIVEADAYIQTKNGVGLALDPAVWTVKVGGTINGEDGGLYFNSNMLVGPVPNSKLTVGSEATILGKDSAAAGITAGVPVDVTNSGLIQGGQYGISEASFGQTPSKGFTITNTAAGEIVGNIGIYDGNAGGPLMTIKNQGSIEGATTGIAWASAVAITNSGTIQGNLKAIDPNAALSSSITNSGAISGGIALSDGDDAVKNTGNIGGLIGCFGGENSVINSGSIGGEIDFGSGDDTMANSGTVDGFVDLQDGINKITNSGAMTGIFSGFGSDTLTNSGSIVAFVAMGDGGNKLTNSGEIGAYIALGIGDDIVTNSGGIGGDVHLGSGNNKLTNSGDIVGEATFGSENDTLTNSGTIGDSIDLGDGSNKLTNTGTISWTVDFGSGDDVGSNTKLIKGEVNLGDGNNTFTNSGTISDHFSAGSGNDTVKNTGTMAGIRLGGGDDSFIGGNHPEYVVDELGGDTYKLGGGDDRLITAGTGIDVFDGGAGQDTFDVSAATDAFFVNLDAKVVTVHNQTLQAASAFSATAQGGSIKGFEIVDGSRQTDFIVGGSVAETISGDYGNDILAGGLGADRLTGGLDDDTFVYFQIKDSGLTRTTRDTITDFEGAGPAGGDVIDLSLINANTKFATDQAFTWIGGDTKFTHLAGELRSVTQGLDTIVQGDVNGDGKADFSIAITGIVALDKSDFAL